MDNVLHTTDYVVASTVLCIILHNVECYIILAESAHRLDEYRAPSSTPILIVSSHNTPCIECMM